MQAFTVGGHSHNGLTCASTLVSCSLSSGRTTFQLPSLYFSVSPLSVCRVQGGPSMSDTNSEGKSDLRGKREGRDTEGGTWTKGKELMRCSVYITWHKGR